MRIGSNPSAARSSDRIGMPARWEQPEVLEPDRIGPGASARERTQTRSV